MTNDWKKLALEKEQLAANTMLTLNEWLDSIGCDKAYRKDMRETYQKAEKELLSQTFKTWPIAFEAGRKEGLHEQGSPRADAEAKLMDDEFRKLYHLSLKATQEELNDVIRKDEREKVQQEIDKVNNPYTYTDLVGDCQRLGFESAREAIKKAIGG